MTDDSTQKGANRPERVTGRDFAARRTIVKGVASAVPVIMTVGCGQAMAQASSSVEHCLIQDSSEIPECIGIDEHDKYARRAADACPVTEGDNALRLYGNKGLRAGDSLLDPTASSGSTSFGNKGLRAGKLGAGQSDATAETKNCLIYVDSNGCELASCGTGGGSPVLASCYNSFLATGHCPDSVSTFDEQTWGKKGRRW